MIMLRSKIPRLFVHLVSKAVFIELGMKILNSSQGRHPRMFLSGVQSEHSPGFPLKACGNDGPGEGAKFAQQAAGN
jgi:hypothetical protein